MSATDIQPQATRIMPNSMLGDSGVPIRVMMVQHEHDVATHSHEFYEFVYVDQGFSSHYYNNMTTILTPGDVFGMRPGDFHGFTRPRQTVLYNCLFHDEVLSHEMASICNLTGVGRVFSDDDSIWQRVHLKPGGRKDVTFYLQKMMDEQTKREAGWELNMKCLLVGFLVSVSRAFADQYKNEEAGEYKYTQYVYKALAYMESKISQPIRVEDIATTIGLSTDYFSRLFKQFTGLAPMEYMKNLRLARATELLKDPHTNVSKVAAEVGIDDSSYFTRLFRQVLGVSPSKYRQMYFR